MSKTINALPGVLKFTNIYSADADKVDALEMLNEPLKDDDIFNTGMSALGDPHADENYADAGKVLLTDASAWVVQHIASLRLYRSNSYVNLAPGDVLNLQVATGAEAAYYLTMNNPLISVEAVDPDPDPEPPVEEKTLASIAITTAPTKVAYSVGDKFDPTGMVVTATYSDDSEAVVDNANLTFDPTVDTDLTAEDTSVTVSYTEDGVTKTAAQTITVS